MDTDWINFNFDVHFEPLTISKIELARNLNLLSSDFKTISQYVLKTLMWIEQQAISSDA